MRTVEEIVKTSKTLAIVGLSPKPHRTSYGVAKALKGFGYKIIPVYPRESEILGEKVYATLKAIPEAVDTVILFVNSDKMLGFVQEALDIHPKCIWAQEGVFNEKASDLVDGSGVDLVMDSCFYKKVVAFR